MRAAYEWPPIHRREEHLDLQAFPALRLPQQRWALGAENMRTSRSFGPGERVLTGLADLKHNFFFKVQRIASGTFKLFMKVRITARCVQC